MKNKNMITGILIAVIVIILALIVFLVVKGNDKDKKDSKDKKDTKTETKYELDDEVYGTITISNIKIETLEKETIVNFTVKNTGTEVYPEGMRVFSIEVENDSIEDVSSYLSSIEANGELDVEIIINGVHKKIDKISIKE
ncbi:MAG: hypothetical protein IKN87_04495 [Bacilli bacterium]|nr:hypothetical protein [Bacilli bacterium]